jgi:hypothetical protein
LYFKKYLTDYTFRFSLSLVSFPHSLPFGAPILILLDFKYSFETVLYTFLIMSLNIRVDFAGMFADNDRKMTERQRKDTESKRKKREEDLAYRERERKKDMEAHQAKREEDPAYREQERKKDMEARQQKADEKEIQQTDDWNKFSKYQMDEATDGMRNNTAAASQLMPFPKLNKCIQLSLSQYDPSRKPIYIDSSLFDTVQSAADLDFLWANEDGSQPRESHALGRLMICTVAFAETEDFIREKFERMFIKGFWIRF